MFRNMTIAKLFAAVAIGGMLTACGGGGGGRGGADPVVAVEDPDLGVAMLAVGLNDAIRGVPRMLNAAGFTNPPAGDVAQATTACAGGGTISTQKTGNQITLAASNCKLLLDMDNLIYNGTWTLQVAAGSCSPPCTLNATIAHPAVGYGYGKADTPTYGDRIEIFDGSIPDEAIIHTAAASIQIDSSTTVVLTTGLMTQGAARKQSVTASVGGQAILSMDRDASVGMSYLNLTVPFEAVVFTAANGAFIRRNGQPDKNVPWSDFVD